MNNCSNIHNSAIINNSIVDNVKIYKNAVISDSKFGKDCSVGNDTNVERCIIENNVIINRRSYINDSNIGKFTYMGINTTMNFTKIGKFCSLARNVDIGGFDHDYRKVTTMPAFRFNQIYNGGGKLVEKIEHKDKCQIGNDVWIAAGAQILHKVKIGNGAVIGAGAVVTKDIPDYAIAVGVPAKVIGYRCSKEHIDILNKIKWWDWPENILNDIIPELISRDIDDNTIEYLLDCYKNI